MNYVEIERKWLVDKFPDLPVDGACRMEQGYLAFEPNTVRIRKTVQNGSSEYILCIKGQGALLHAEIELPLTAEQYDALVLLLAAPAATKELRTYRLPGGSLLECSLVDEGNESSFFYAEVEFDTVQAADAFVPPAFLGREVTGEPGYSMAAYCRQKGTC